MSKVRIYELAKELGQKSKELAEKLKKMGFPIASHSSSVDEDMAADIRKKIRSDAAAGGATVGRLETRSRGESAPAKSSRVVRRRSRAEKEEAAKRQEEAEALALEAEEQAILLAEAEEREAAAALEKSAEPVREEEPQVEITATEPTPAETTDPVEPSVATQPEEVLPAEQRPEPVLLATDDKPENDDTPQIEQAESALATSEEKNMQPAVTEPEPTKQKKTRPAPQTGAGNTPVHKPLAKVIGRVVIPIPEKKVKVETKRAPSRPTRPVASNIPVVGPAPTEENTRDGKGKKKGKRVVSIQSDDDLSRKATRGAKKSRGRQDLSVDGDGEYIRMRGRGKKKKKEIPQPIAETKAIKRRIKVVSTITVGDLAKRMGVKGGEVIAALMKLGVLATLNQALDVDTAALVSADFGYEVEQAMTEELEVEALQEQEAEMGGAALPRPPVVTVMGHVDHGKTSILDAIRKTDVAAGEAGGITQHIGAYHVQAPSGDLTFVDTPGHAAFTEMRSRGAKVTDIVILVVAADDGVMDQTREAIAHAKAAEVPIVVAINKIDKDGADADRIKRELSDFGLMPEEWGGQTIYCETSAKKRIGIENLLESVQLQAEILELRADATRKAKGTVIEAQLHKGRGPVATVLVQEGTLRVGDFFVAGIYSGKVRTLTNERGELLQEAGPSIPAEVQGLSGVPQGGDEFIVLTDEKMAKSVASARQLKAREHELAANSKVSLDNLFAKMAEQDMKELRVILRADVQGTLQAFGQAAENLSTDVIRVRSLHEGTGTITENDIHLAAASDAIIIGFNVRPAVKVKELAEREGVEVRSYDVIYHALEDIEKAMKGMLEPTFEERVIGTAEVRETFQVPKIGIIAGCGVIAGKIERNARVRVLRDGVVVYTGRISSLKRFKDDAKEVLTGFECGIGVEHFNDIKVGDHLEAFVMDEVEATL